MKSAKAFVLPLIVPLLFLLLWHVMAQAVRNDIILPDIPLVWDIMVSPHEDLISMGTLPANTLISLARVFSGYLVAVVLAIPLGIVMGYRPDVNTALSTFLGLFRSIPPLAWVPLVLAWFGMLSLADVFSVPIGPAYPYFHNIKLSMIFIIFIMIFLSFIS